VSASRRILKWTVLPFEPMTVPGRVISAGWQGDSLVVWTESGLESDVLAVPTGGYVPDGYAFVATAMHPTLLDGMPLVVHVYTIQH